MKLCTKCKQMKLEKEFNKNSKLSSGLRSWCRECDLFAYNEYKKKNYELEKERKREWARTPSGIYNRLKYGKGRKELCISKESFIKWYNIQDKKCVYCDISEKLLNHIKDTQNNKCINLSIDRVDNKRGYEEGNLVLACLRCNYIKSDFFTFEEMREIGQNFVKTKWEDEIRRKS